MANETALKAQQDEILEYVAENGPMDYEAVVSYFEGVGKAHYVSQLPALKRDGRLKLKVSYVNGVRSFTVSAQE